MRKPLVLHPAALVEAEAAIAWYRERSKRAAAGFLTAVDAILQEIAEHPERFQGFDFGSRRALLRRFPYYIVFRETDTNIEVIALAHGKRAPGYWKDRVE